MGAGIRVFRHRHRVDVVEVRHLVGRVEQVDPERDLIAGALLRLGEQGSGSGHCQMSVL